MCESGNSFPAFFMKMSDGRLIPVLRFVLHLEDQQKKREYGAEQTPQIRVLPALAGHDKTEESRNSEKKQDEDQFTHVVRSCAVR
jgi:hypothetical protein